MKRRLARRSIVLALALATLALGAGSGCSSLGVGAEPIEVNLAGLTPLPSTAF
jgi:hypothetical protein